MTTPITEVEAVLAARLAELTLALCRTASPTGAERALCDELERWGHSRGLPQQRVGNSLLIEGAKPLLLAGHLDTVPAYPGEGESRREGERVYGKGASDMKGGLAVILALLEDLPQAQRPFVVLYDREEGPYAENGLEHLFAAGLLPRATIAVCLEPTDNRLQLGCVGSLHATVRFRGQAAHSARPWEGSNAVHAAGALLTSLASAQPRAVEVDGLTYHEVTHVTRAAGGWARNVIPDLFELNLNHRFAPGVSLDQAVADVREIVGSTAEVEFSDLSPSGPTCAANPELQRLRAQGLAVEAKQAWTDVARFGVHGIDAINFGPGQPAQAHQRDEWCDVPALARAYLVLHAWLAR